MDELEQRAPAFTIRREGLRGPGASDPVQVGQEIPFVPHPIPPILLRPVVLFEQKIGFVRVNAPDTVVAPSEERLKGKFLGASGAIEEPPRDFAKRSVHGKNRDLISPQLDARGVAVQSRCAPSGSKRMKSISRG